MEKLIPAYVRSVQNEIELVGSMCQSSCTARSIFLGGGTPSLLEIDQLGAIVGKILQVFGAKDKIEVTIEANPGTIDFNKLSEMRMIGINRISFGVQSFDSDDLRLLRRMHDPGDARQAIQMARKAGFDNISADLIFGLPSQSLRAWSDNLRIVTDLGVDHLSIYGLTLEEGTCLYEQVNRGELEVPDEDLSADMYELAEQYLSQTGYKQYEISNWARYDNERDFRCQHNLQYWRNLPYLGFGAGAHGYAAGVRTANVDGIRTYIEKVKQRNNTPFPLSPANRSRIYINREDEIRETMMVGLRLTEEGVSLHTFLARFGEDAAVLFRDQIKRLMDQGLIEMSDRIRLTQRGRLLGNKVFAEFVNAEI